MINNLILLSQMSDFYAVLMQEWERVKPQISISRILAHYQVPMQTKGNFALCPFHDDHKPSMHVRESEGLYHCFSCGASGDAITFIRHKEQCNFNTAAYLACNICGIDLTITPLSQHKPLHQDMYNINKEVADYFHLRLLEDSQMLEILKKRNITTNHIIRHKLGYCTNLKKMIKPFINIDNLKKIGMINEQNRFIFNNRIIFPIMLFTGHVAGFGARQTYREQLVKYINSHESPIFEKRKIVYNMQHLMDLPDKPIYIVEGYFDAIKLQEIGYRAVALMGTSMSQHVFQMLCKYGNDLVLALDQDKAGIDATNNILEKTILPNLTTKNNIFVAIYRHKDPAEAVDANQFKHMPIPISTYYQFCCDQNYSEGSKALRHYYLISKLITNNEARNDFYSKWQSNFSERQETFATIQSFRSRNYLQNDLKKQKYLQYYQATQFFPNILNEIKINHPHPLMISEINKTYYKARILFNAQKNVLSTELLGYKYCYDLIIDLAVENALETLKKKSQEKLTQEEALKIFNTTMAINKLRKSE